MAQKESGLLSTVLKSFFFRKATGRAGRYVRNSRSMFQLANDALHKSGGLSGATFTAAKEQVALLVRLVRASASGEYKDIPWKTLVKIVAVLIYFVSPIDILPDFLPIVGISDDIVLVTWLFTSIKGDLGKFQAWEASRKQTVTLTPVK